MIIGKGLLATAFSKYRHDLDEVCIYAAGVSNSANLDPAEFERERQLLAQTLGEIKGKKRFVYFSTCSVFDPSMAENLYVLHKLKMEELVGTFENHLIIRLPQVVGPTLNPNTLFNYLSGKILRGETFTVWASATRNLIDVEDVAAVVYELINDKKTRNSTINIANSSSIKVKAIVEIIENMLGRKAIYNEEAKGADYKIDISQIEPLLKKLKIDFNGETYIKNLIHKYYMYHSQIASHLS